MINKHSKYELYILIVVYIVIILFLFLFKRPMQSELEKRKLTEFPIFNFKEYANGNFNNNLSKWFSDTTPFRDNLVSLSFNIKKFNGLETEFSTNNLFLEEINENEFEIEKNNIATPNNLTANISTKSELTIKKQIDFDVNDVDYAGFDISNKYLLTGKGKEVRAMSIFAGISSMDERYPQTINEYKKIFKNQNVYLMIPPTSTAFYCPDELKKYTGNQKRFLDKLVSYLDKDIQYIDIYDTLQSHINEYIYLRTDHHWTPLAAYYSAEQFAKTANVEFKQLDNYEEVVVEDYVGSLYSFSKDDRLNQFPDTFIYYMPNDINYDTQQIQYTLDKKGNPIEKSEKKQVNFFVQYSFSGKKRAYLAFMGGDINTTFVKTTNQTGRNLLILKDSFGNPIPGYLFYGFDNIVIVDYRYFMDNIKQFVADNNITDILFINNVETAMKDIASKQYRKFLNY